ncbi:hypothetical protein QFC24_006406 [Naganishia onofrii]|uniref:Uncharacterized protein n=1 Tax=Naganishia onofrii TaxID=1851511 RepID=A0ACC2X4L7_9TREE|nr:hypothetical protein QFC24_006406 [Naganishia onofrii]
MPQESTKKIPPSRHMVWYREIVPATVPVILLGTGIFFTLTLLQTHLSHSRSLSDSSARITRLEEELAELREKHSRQAVNWSEGLGRVVRRVRDLGREVHEFDDLKSLAATGASVSSSAAPSTLNPNPDVGEQRVPVGQEVQETPMSLPARIMAAFGGASSPTTTSSTTRTTIPSASSSVGSIADAAAAAAASVADRTAAKANELANRSSSIASDLANTTFQKMDNLRSTSSVALTNASHTIDQVVSDVQSEAHERFSTLPHRPDTDLNAAIKDAPGGEAFAARLLATFGNPRKDRQRTEAELERLEALARETSIQDLSEKASTAAHLVRGKVHDSFERIAEHLDPAAQRAGEKMDQLRETSGQVVERVEEKVDAVVHELREEAEERFRTLPPTPETDLRGAIRDTPGGESFAARLLATFGNPRKDGQKTEAELARLEALARETSVQDLKAKAVDAAHVVSANLHDGFEAVAERMDPVARQAGEKMDQWRMVSGKVVDRVEDKVEGVVSDVRSEAEERFRTLPPTPETDLKAAVKEAPVGPSFAARLMSTFGNPTTDSTKTTKELAHVGQQLSHIAQEQETRAVHLAQDVVSGVREMEHKVQGGLQELRAEGVKPLLSATADKVDSLRTTSQQALAHAEEQIQQHLPSTGSLPRPRPVKTADGEYPAETAELGVLASRLIATFGRPSEDRAQTTREVAQVKNEAERIVERGEEVARPALERAERVVEDVKGRVVAEVDEGKKRWWS